MAAAGGARRCSSFRRDLTFGQRPEMALEHFRRIAEVTDLPLIVFQYPLAGGRAIRSHAASASAMKCRTVRAIKDWCASPQLHERQSACCSRARGR